MKKTILVFMVFISLVFIASCSKRPEEIKEPEEDNTEPQEKEETPKILDEPHEHIPSDWIYPEGWHCEDEVMAWKECTICGEKLDEELIFIDHIFHEETTNPTCTVNGSIVTTCENCDYYFKKVLYARGHEKGDYVITTAATPTEPGIKTLYCTKCAEVIDEVKYVDNGYLAHGKLKVVGTDLVDANNEKYQLYGLSYHGLQWFGKYVNKDTIVSLQNYFGINVIRLACYTSEGGYAEGGISMKQKYKDYIDTAIKVGSQIGLYVVVDWHMVGAENVNDKNPLYYMEDAQEFFEYVSTTYKDYDNVIYEIMNEPCGDTTWEDCKEYANTIIPIIRKNTDAVILVGNPHWSSDLKSVINDPLDYNNIMYTYHFYAGDISSTSEVVNAYSKGIPVFISEFGFMDASGDGKMSYASGENWLKVLDERNISYIAWNISNSKGSSSIISNSSWTMTDFSDSNLKEWGIYLKNYYRTKSGLGEE